MTFTYSRDTFRSAHFRADHPGEFLYPCGICDLGFMSKGSCYNHRKVHERGNEHSCDICGKVFNVSTNNC